SRRDAGATVEQQTSPRLYDAQWNDDIHHALHVLITGETDGYYCDYSDQPIRHLGRCLAEGFSYQGQVSRMRNNTPSGENSPDLIDSVRQLSELLYRIHMRILPSRVRNWTVTNWITPITSLGLASTVTYLRSDVTQLFLIFAV